MKGLSNYLIVLTVFNIISCKNSNTTQQKVSVQIYSKVFPSSKSKVIGALFNGKKNGLWITYDSTGRVETEQTFKDDKEFGEIKMYDDGYLNQKVYDKIADGDTISSLEKYAINGKIIVKGFYLHGEKYGIWTYYYLNGKVKYIKKYIGKKSIIIFNDTKMPLDEDY